MLRQKNETKNENEKKNTETETSELFSDFKTVLLSEQKNVVVVPSPDFTKNK